MAPKPKAPPASPEIVELYEKLIANNAAIIRKGATLPYISHKGAYAQHYIRMGTWPPPGRRGPRGFYEKV